MKKLLRLLMPLLTGAALFGSTGPAPTGPVPLDPSAASIDVVHALAAPAAPGHGFRTGTGSQLVRPGLESGRAPAGSGSLHPQSTALQLATAADHETSASGLPVDAAQGRLARSGRLSNPSTAPPVPAF